MIKYLLRRLVNYTILTMLATVFAYATSSAFMDPSRRYLGRNPPLDPASVDAILDGMGVKVQVVVARNVLFSFLEKCVFSP